MAAKKPFSSHNNHFYLSCLLKGGARSSSADSAKSSNFCSNTVLVLRSFIKYVQTFTFRTQLLTLEIIVRSS